MIHHTIKDVHISQHKLHVQRPTSKNSLTQSSLSTLERFLLGSRDDVLDKVLSRWSPDLILRLRSLSSSTLYAIEAYKTRQWNAEVLLSRWFTSPREFLKLLNSSNGIISGSEAQQFFGRRAFLGKDLDIYIPLHGLLPIGRYLKKQGFMFQPAVKQHPFFEAAALSYTAFIGEKKSSHHDSSTSSTYSFSTFNFARPPTVYGQLTGRQAQIIAVSGNPIEFIICNFHSTGVMNFLTGSYAVSLFPRSTFVDSVTVTCQDLTKNASTHDIWMGKYRNRGFKVLVAGSPLPSNLELQEWARFVGDHWCWIMPYNWKGLGQSKKYNIYPYAFEVLDTNHGMAPAGAALRIGPRFYYSSMAHIMDPLFTCPEYRSIETAIAFLPNIWAHGLIQDMVVIDNGDLGQDQEDIDPAQSSDVEEGEIHSDVATASDVDSDAE